MTATATTLDHTTVQGDSVALTLPGPGDAARLAEIALAFARHGVLTVAGRGGRLVVRPRQQAPKALAVSLRRSFVVLGPTFVKLGQLIASSPGLFPETLADEMRRLLDSVPAEPSARVRRIIEMQFDASIPELFAEFDDTPLAAASIAQVHRARLHDGRAVVVKVRRPRLRRRIEQDLRLLRLLALPLSRAGRGRVAQPCGDCRGPRRHVAGGARLRTRSRGDGEHRRFHPGQRGAPTHRRTRADRGNGAAPRTGDDLYRRHTSRRRRDAARGGLRP